MTEKTAEKPAGEKLILFNHGRNPFRLKDGPNGEVRIFKIGQQLECADQAEYDQLKGYKGIGTSQQVAPSLQNLIVKLETEKKALTQEVAALKAQLEKFQTAPEEVKVKERKGKGAHVLSASGR